MSNILTNIKIHKGGLEIHNVPSSPQHELLLNLVDILGLEKHLNKPRIEVAHQVPHMHVFP